MNTNPIELLLTSIGIFESEQLEPYQAGRQPDELGLPGIIQLHKGFNYEQALSDLNGCTHIWVIFGFHHNQNWKPLVQTPRTEQKIGVFATRAPYRPNPIGLSLVSLISIDKLKITVGPNDILNGSPVFDIKPYHPEYDLAEEASIAWIDETLLSKNNISFSPQADEQLDFLETHGLKELRPFIQRQLEYDALNHKKKRVEAQSGYYTLSYRTWRIDFTSIDNTVGILCIRSGYTEAHMFDATDTYSDKKLHTSFKKTFA